jgi:murein DD-endopeptidase MepM/ murein hydrolase activator NlpD
MIKFFLRKSPVSAIILLVSIVIFACFSFFLLLGNDNNVHSVNGANPILALVPSPLLKADTSYRAFAHPSGLQGDESLLWRCLLPSDRILNPLGSAYENTAGLEPAALAANLNPLSIADAERFRQEINLQQDMNRLAQIFSAQPGTTLGSDHSVSQLSDGLDLRALVKPTGKLMLNPNYPRYCFPVSWPFFFRDSFGDPRGEHRLHIGIDIFAEEGTQVYAMTDGVIQQLADWPRAGNTLLLRGNDGRGYIYMHLQRYAEGISAGKAVKKGELIAYVGHTGTTTSPPHLHFQVHADESFAKECAVNPYEALATLCQGHGVTDLGQSKPHFSMLRGPDQLVYSSKKSPRKDYFVVVKGPVSVKTALIKSWDVKPAASQDPGLAWRVPNPTWKVPRADLRVPDEKTEASPSSTRVTWTFPKPKSSTHLLFPQDQ